MNMFLSEMQDKEVISIVNELNYGHIIDVELDSSGNIISFVAQNKKLLRTFKNDEVTFSYLQIEKIGKDVILVRV